MIISYSLFILLNNVDMLVGYWLLSRAELDAYAASALLPKAIITATFAVAQVVLPVVTDQRVGGRSFRLSVVKGVAIATGMAAPRPACCGLQSRSFKVHRLQFVGSISNSRAFWRSGPSP